MIDRIKNEQKDVPEQKKLKLAPAILAAMSLYAGSTRAAIPTGNDFDADFGTNYTPSAGAIYLLGSIPHNFTQNGVGFRGNFSSGSIVESTTDGINFTDITALLTAAESGMDATYLGVCDYSGTWDKLMVTDVMMGNIYIFEGIGDTGMVTSSTQLNGTFDGCGSIDEDSGRYFVSNSDSSSISRAYEAFESSSPSLHYSYSSSDIVDIHVDITNDQLLFRNSDSSDKLYWVENVSGSPVATYTNEQGGVSGLFSAAETGTYDTFLYQDETTGLWNLEYGYDDASAAPTDTDTDGVTDADDLCAGTTDMSTVDGDGCSDSQRDSDGDGSMADVDCDDADAADFPGNAITYNDGADNNCDETDAPEITPMTMSVSEMQVGDSVDFTSTTQDDETLTADLTTTWEVRNSAGTLVDSSTGAVSSFTTSTADTYTVTVTVTDGDSSVSDSDTLVVSEEPVVYEELPSSGALTEGTTYYEDASSPSSGSLTVLSSGVTIAEDGTITLTSPSGISFSGMDLDIEGENESAQVVGDVYTYDNMEGSVLMGVLAADGPDFNYTDNTDPSSIMTVSLDAGNFDAVGIYDDLYDDPETEEADEFFGVQADEVGNYTISDLTDNEEADADTDTDADTDSDSDTDSDTDTDTDTDGDTDSDTDTDSDGDTDADSDSDADGDSDADTDTGSTNSPDCEGCATENGANGSWALGAAALAALARRRKQV